MDARVDGRPVTPRGGYPVEVQALWVNALGSAVELLRTVKRDASEWQQLRDRAVDAFGRMFPLGDGGLADVVGDAGDVHHEVRPNQLLAVSLPYAPLVNDREAARIVVDACRTDLLTSVGLRTLARGDPAYRGRHRGGPVERDEAYHQGTVWPWLLGAYADAVRRAGEDASGLSYGLELHLGELGLGSVSETFDGDPPHGGTGCPFQAWSVAELIRTRWTAQPAGS
jgi:predicted glycogen debranching enzyme